MWLCTYIEREQGTIRQILKGLRTLSWNSEATLPGTRTRVRPDPPAVERCTCRRHFPRYDSWTYFPHDTDQRLAAMTDDRSRFPSSSSTSTSTLLHQKWKISTKKNTPPPWAKRDGKSTGKTSNFPTFPKCWPPEPEPVWGTISDREKERSKEEDERNRKNPPENFHFSCRNFLRHWHFPPSSSSSSRCFTHSESLQLVWRRRRWSCDLGVCACNSPLKVMFIHIGTFWRGRGARRQLLDIAQRRGLTGRFYGVGGSSTVELLRHKIRVVSGLCACQIGVENCSKMGWCKTRKNDLGLF